MNKRIGWLGGLLAAQLLIVAGLLVGSVTESDAEAERFLAFDPAAVTKFTVAEADEAVLLLREGGWRRSRLALGERAAGRCRQGEGTAGRVCRHGRALAGGHQQRQRGTL